MDNVPVLISFKSVMLPLSAALGASVGVERVLEVCKNVLEPLIGFSGARKVGTTRGAERQVDDLRYIYQVTEDSRTIDSDPKQRANVLKAIDAQMAAAAGRKARKELEDRKRDVDAAGEWSEQYPAGRVLVQDATDPDDGTTLRAFILQLLGVAAGIVLARMFDIQLFKAFQVNVAAPWLDYLLTGLLIGGGSAPVHVLIRFISERKVPAAAEEVSAEEKKPAPEAALSAAAAVITAPSAGALVDWVDIPYAGGVDREILENIHRRQKDPDMVVFHHTAMSSRSTFEDVVRVIKGRTDSKGNKWLTGYNCVVLADGSVNAFCRWDRYGSHAVGYNQRSLGIAFNGNFETDPKVPFSNPNGKYGPPRPTEEQLKAGARVVALWTFLYPKIAVDFVKTIVPHKNVSQKTCPGGMFPYDEFQKWVEFYHNRWNKSDEVKERIALFKRKPCLYTPKEG